MPTYVFILANLLLQIMVIFEKRTFDQYTTLQNTAVYRHRVVNRRFIRRSPSLLSCAVVRPVASWSDGRGAVLRRRDAD